MQKKSQIVSTIRLNGSSFGKLTCYAVIFMSLIFTSCSGGSQPTNNAVPANAANTNFNNMSKLGNSAGNNGSVFSANKSADLPQFNKNKGENKMDGYILQLSIEIDKWTGKKNTLIPMDKSLEKIWDEAKKGIPYITKGRNDLIDHLKKKSEFKDASTKILKGDFDSDKIVTFGDLVAYLKTQKTAPPVLADAVSLGIINWVNEDRNFFAETTLAEIWIEEDYKTNGIARLVSTFKKEEYFEKCEQVASEKFSEKTFGEISTVSALYKYLKPCK